MGSEGHLKTAHFTSSAGAPGRRRPGATAAAGDPGSTVARFAEWFPFSSPFAMAARGATDPAVVPHVLALGWQALWVAITIWAAARLFRTGVLKSGGGLRFGWSRRMQRTAE